MNEKLKSTIGKVLNAGKIDTLCFRNTEILEAEEGYIKLKLKITKDSLNPYGVIHGGMLFTLCDTCAGLSAITLGEKVVTLNSTINFIKGKGDGIIYAESKLLHKGKTTSVFQVDVTDEKNKLLCTSNFTMFSLGKISEFNN